MDRCIGGESTGLRVEDRLSQDLARISVHIPETIWISEDISG